METDRISVRRGNPPICISIGRVTSFSTSGGDMPPAVASTCTCTLVTSGKASMGICFTASMPKPSEDECRQNDQHALANGEIEDRVDHGVSLPRPFRL